MDPLLKRGKMRAWTATNVSEASGSSSRRFRPEVSGSRWNPSASEVLVPIPKWRSNASQSSRPQKRKYETAGIIQTTGAKFHRQEDKRQQTASEKCSTASNPFCLQLNSYGLEIVRQKRESKRIKSEICMNRSAITA
jgi:hypothetical protein